MFALPSNDTPPIVLDVVNPSAVPAVSALPVTLPVTAPTKLVAVATPETLSPSNSVCPSMSTFPLTSSVVNVETPVEFTFPSTLPVILPVTFPVTAPVTLPTTLPVTAPTKLVALTIPVALILPIEFIPTPYLPKISGDPPTWKLCLGSVVAIPTLPIAYIDVNPKPTSTSSHCDAVSYTHLTLPTM